MYNPVLGIKYMCGMTKYIQKATDNYASDKMHSPCGLSLGYRAVRIRDHNWDKKKIGNNIVH